MIQRNFRQFMKLRNWAWFGIIQKTRPLIGMINIEEEIKILESTADNADGTRTWSYFCATPMPTYDIHVAAYDDWAETAAMLQCKRIELPTAGTVSSKRAGKPAMWQRGADYSLAPVSSAPPELCPHPFPFGFLPRPRPPPPPPRSPLPVEPPSCRR